LDRLELSVPGQISLGLLPRRLSLETTPASLEMGVDCNMPEMCGLDPCLCGVPDEYGACACNGTKTTLPTLSVASDTPNAVGVIQLGNAYWLMPWAEGEATLLVEARLPHYESATEHVEVEVDAPFAPVLLPITALFVLLLAIIVLVRRFMRRRSGRVRGVVSLIALPLAAALLLMPLAACATPVRVDESSPRVASASILSQGDGTEAGQRVEARLVFDRPLVLKGDALDGLELTLNGAPLDTRVIAVAAELEGDRTLCVRLSPAEGTGDTASARYFALYEGALSIAGRDASGGVARLTGAAGQTGAATGQANAVIEQPLLLQIPSGLVIEPVESVTGEASSGTVARASFRVATVPGIRAVSWFEFEPGGERVLVHNHEFISYLDGEAGRERYASYLVEPLKRGLGSNYSVSAQGDTVTISAREARDGQVIAPAVVEGVMK
jgi:hypothetical protein